MASGKWQVVMEPHGNNPGFIKRAAAEAGITDANPENTGGIIIYIQNGTEKHEVSRVAFVRRASKNPDMSFKKQLRHEKEKADAAVAALNELFDGAGQLQ